MFETKIIPKEFIFRIIALYSYPFLKLIRGITYLLRLDFIKKGVKNPAELS